MNLCAMHEQVDFSFALEDWQLCRKYLDSVPGKWSYEPGVNCEMVCFNNHEIIEYNEKLYKVEVVVCANQCIWIKVYEAFDYFGKKHYHDSKCEIKYYEYFDDFDEVKFHIRLSSLKINPCIQ